MPTRLHEMNRLEDMGRFPAVVYVGATANVLAEVAFFYWLHGRTGGRLAVGLVGAVVLLGFNLLPVVVLRWREGAAGLADTPPVEQMGFVRDQHRFASWVYAVASGGVLMEGSTSMLMAGRSLPWANAASGAIPSVIVVKVRPKRMRLIFIMGL